MFTFQNENYLNNIYTVTYYICKFITYGGLFYLSLQLYHHYPFQEDNNDTREIESSLESWLIFGARVCILLFAFTLREETED